MAPALLSGNGSPIARRKRKTRAPSGAAPLGPGHGHWHGDAPGQPDPPIIITAQFDAITADLFERHRQTFFPPDLNRTPAHLTLFHALPGAELPAILNTLANESRRAPIRARVSHLMPLGRGVAYAISSEALVALRTGLAAAFAPWLTGQDRQRFRPHVTVQNKISPAKARDTLELLSRSFSPFDATVEGLQLWHYRGGPWSPIAAVAFTA